MRIRQDAGRWRHSWVGDNACVKESDPAVAVDASAPCVPDQSPSLVRVALDRRARIWPDRRFLAGGSPWRLVRLSQPAAGFASRLRARGDEGLVPDASDVAAAHVLVERGLAHPAPVPCAGPHDVTVVVPAYGRPDSLARCLEALAGLTVIVVDDATPDPRALRDVVEAHGATYLRLEVNAGPGAARNAGAAACESRLIAFVDSDCQPVGGWLDLLVAHFADPRVGAAAPRISSTMARTRPEAPARVLDRFEALASSLDMGGDPALVRPGAALGFVPAATLVVRRSAFDQGGFEEGMRVGEDVDLVWRMADAGWHVRYVPSARVVHESRDTWGGWLRQRFDYGTSAGALDRRFPGRLAPLRVSAGNATALGLLTLGRWIPAALSAGTSSALLSRKVIVAGGGPRAAASIGAIGLRSDASSVGHALRREYWPVGLAAVALAPKVPAARIAVALMVAPLVRDWAKQKDQLDPLRYVALRLVADAAYGSGVLVSAWRQRDVGSIKPALRGSSGHVAQRVSGLRDSLSRRRIRAGSTRPR